MVENAISPAVCFILPPSPEKKSCSSVPTHESFPFVLFHIGRLELARRRLDKKRRHTRTRCRSQSPRFSTSTRVEETSDFTQTFLKDGVFAFCRCQWSERRSCSAV
jgi:hypothetical protein